MLQQVVDALDLASDELAHGTVNTGHDDNELVSAYAAKDIDGAEAVLQQLCNPFQHLIADRMAVGVIDSLEVIDVDDDERHMLRVRAFHEQIVRATIEKTRERIVTDSSGRVLLHEAERTTEHYKGRGKSLTHQQQNRQEKSEVTSQGTVTETNDSTYNGGSINEVTVVKKKSWRWLWYVGILASLLIVGYIISKVIRR